MGNQKFKFSDMIPNAWFYKLKDMTKPPPKSTTTTTKRKKHRLPPPPPPPTSSPSTTSSPPQFQPRKSYHFTRDLPLPPPEDPPISPPRKSKSSTKSRKPTGKIKTTTTAAATATTAAATNSDKFPPNLENAPPKTAERFDIVIDIKQQHNQWSAVESISNKFNGFEFQLPRISTKPKQSTQEEKPISPAPARRFSGGTPAGVRLKINSPKVVGGRKQGQNGNYNGGGGGGRRGVVKKRRSISESFAVVKSSEDPHRDFKESMVEMIVQNNLRASKDLEDLLACYLSLNSDEYHDVIIKVFKQIWYDLSGLKPS